MKINKKKKVDFPKKYKILALIQADMVYFIIAEKKKPKCLIRVLNAVSNK